MMRWIVSSSLNFRFLVGVVAAVVMFFGISQLRNMPVDVLPEFAPPFVEIQTEALGLSAAEVENLVTLNIEELVSGVSWLQTIRSTSVPGLSSVTLTFEPGTDVMRARQLVAERLTSTFMLPNVSKAPIMLPPLSATSRVMMVGLSSKEVSPLAMGVLAHWTIRPALLSVPGVSNVSVWGQQDRQLQVQVDQARLRAHDVRLEKVIETTGNAMFVSPLTFLEASTPGTGGFIDAAQQRLDVRHVLPISTAADLAKVTVSHKKKSDGSPLRLGDLGRVVENHQPLIGDAVLKDGPGLLVVVEKLPGSNTLNVTRAVEARLNTLRAGLPGIKIDTTIYRPATFIGLAIDRYARALLLGALLAVVLLFVFVRQWRPALVGVAAIVSSLAAALFVLQLRGATMNVMVLAGLAIAVGAVVDDAVVGIETILRRVRQRRGEGNDRPLAAIVLDASLEMRSALLFATLIVLLAVVPVLFVEDVLGAFLQPLAVSYALAVAVSMVVALTLTPALSLMLLSKASPERRESPLILWLHRRYDVMLARTIRRPRAVVAATGLIALAGLAVLPYLGLSLLPSFREPDLMIQLEGPPATSRSEMARITNRIGRELQAIPGVRNFGAHIGRAVMGDQVVGINSATLWVSVDPSINYDATATAIRRAVDGYPGFVHVVQTYTEKTLRQTLTGSNDTMVVRLYGPDRKVLLSKADEVRRVLSGIAGIAGLHRERQVEEPYVEVQVDLAKAERYGIKPGDVRRQAATWVNGVQAGSLFEGQKVFDVVVWSTPESRQSLTGVRNLQIDTPDGGRVRLGDVADIRIAPTPTAIKREAVSRRIDVGFNVRGRDVGSVARDVRRAIQGIGFPLEHRAVLLGEFEERQEARVRILISGIVAVAGVFLLLQASFRSWRLAALTFLTWPAALAGGVLAAFAGGGIISLGSLAGFLTVLGVTARTSMTLIGHFQHLEQEEGESFGPELVRRGSRERVAPILMTALTAGVVFVPFVLFSHIPGREIVRPMALTILGGLVTSTLLNLFVVPFLYLRFGGGSVEPDLALPPASASRL